MPQFTPLNLEQNLFRYLADKLKTEGYNIFWKDSNQTESVAGTTTVTLVRQFPEDMTAIAKQDGPTGESIINVPAFSIFSQVPETNETERMGIGESAFVWSGQVRIDGFANDKFEWYKFASWFQDWFGNPDTYVDLYDYEADISSETPQLAVEKIRFQNAFIVRQEFFDNPATKFYINLTITTLFIE